MSRHYYKVICDEEAAMSAQGLGYEEIFGNGPRYFWDLEDAQKRAKELNDISENDNGAGHFDVEQRDNEDDGSWWDDDDEYSYEQLGFSKTHPASCSCGSPNCSVWQKSMIGE